MNEVNIRESDKSEGEIERNMFDLNGTIGLLDAQIIKSFSIFEQVLYNNALCDYDNPVIEDLETKTQLGHDINTANCKLRTLLERLEIFNINNGMHGDSNNIIRDNTHKRDQIQTIFEDGQFSVQWNCKTGSVRVLPDGDWLKLET